MRVTIAWRVVGDVFGKYKVLGPLGKGGMAAVYLGEHVDLGHKVAIKVLRPEQQRRRVSVERFMKEARAIERLDHPGVVRLFEVGQRDGAAYFVMELLRGESLSRRLAKVGALSERVAAAFASQMAQALAHAHQSGIVHRDLKPGNVFLVPHGGCERAVILDFGIAKELFADATSGTELTGVGIMVGTPSYMSPEQCKDGRSVDHRSDIYSLGVLLYRMVAGVLPFDDADTAQLIDGHIHRAPAPPSVHDAAISPAMDRVILRCLAKEPAARWQSMGAVVSALAPLHPSQPVRRRTTLLPLPPPPEKTPAPELLRADTATGEITQADEVPDAAAQIEDLVGTATVPPAPAPRSPRRRPPTWLAASAAAAVLAVVAVAVAAGGGDEVDGDAAPAPPAVVERRPEAAAEARPAAEPRMALEPAALAFEPELEAEAALAVEPELEAEAELEAELEAEAGAEAEAAPEVEIEVAEVEPVAVEADAPAASAQRRRERTRARAGQRRRGAAASERRQRRQGQRARERQQATNDGERAADRREKSFDQVETPALF